MEAKMKKHVTVVAAIQIGMSLLGLIGTVAIFFGLSVAISSVGDDEVALSVLSFLRTSLPLFTGSIAVLGLVGAIGLFTYKPWARYIIIVVAALGLLAIPIGTLKGVYFLWVMMQEETVRLFQPQTTAAI